MQEKKDLTFFFTYSIYDEIDPQAERICDQLHMQEIKLCIITKGDFKLANIIIKKHLKMQEDDKKRNNKKENKNEDQIRSTSANIGSKSGLASRSLVGTLSLAKSFMKTICNDIN